MNDPEIEKMIREVGLFCTEIRKARTPRWLTLLGTSGTGKTHCCKRVWRWMRDQKQNVDCATNDLVRFWPRFIHWPSFVDGQLREQNFDEYNDMQNWPFMAIDDIGAERDSTGFATEKLCTLLGCRENKWTILTSNLGLAHFSKIDVRIADRMIRSGNRYCDVQTKSYARKKMEESQ